MHRLQPQYDIQAPPPISGLDTGQAGPGHKTKPHGTIYVAFRFWPYDPVSKTPMRNKFPIFVAMVLAAATSVLILNSPALRFIL